MLGTLCSDGDSTASPLPAPKEGQGKDCHRLATAVTSPQRLGQPLPSHPRQRGRQGRNNPSAFDPTTKAQVTSLLGSRNKAKPPQPPARLSGPERSNERSPAAATLLPAGSRGSGWGPGRPSCLQLPEPQPQTPSLPLQVTTAPPNPTTIPCRSARGDISRLSPSPLPPPLRGTAAAETFPVLFLQDRESHE